jgi:uncharacterized protein YecE (DUF72 family)
VKILLGTSGYFYQHWRGKFYPPDLHPGRWLDYYVQYFDTVEMNVTFYRFPSQQMIKSWYRRAPKNFIFALKVNRLITHEKKLRRVENLLRRFLGLADLLKEKLGPLLFQLPPSLHKDLEVLENFLSLLQSEHADYENVIEFRHISWYDDEVYRILDKFSIAYCIVSCPDFPVHMETTAPFAYLRWHGLQHWYRYDYSKEELEWWAKEITKLKVERVYGFFNNDYNAWAPKNCLELKKMLGV